MGTTGVPLRRSAALSQESRLHWDKKASLERCAGLGLIGGTSLTDTPMAN